RHSFPTRRSSDLVSSSFGLLGDPRAPKREDAPSSSDPAMPGSGVRLAGDAGRPSAAARELARRLAVTSTVAEHLLRLGYGTSGEDRKSTRLNSSHVKISYAVFCLKK